MSTHKEFSAAEYFARFNRISWKQVFALIGGAPFRLHHYRDVHTQMLRDALCVTDCQRNRGSCDGE